MIYCGWEGLEVFMSFWDNALPFMDKKKVKQKDIALLTGHSSGRVSDWFKEKVVPKADDALKIADLLGVSVRYLVTGEDEEGLLPRERELLDVCKLMPESKFSIVLKNAQAIKEDMDRELSGGLSSADSEAK